MAAAMAPPADPIAAVTHPDPYPYYAELVAERPLHRDAALGLWVAASAEAVTGVLRSDLCRVRPPAEPVPKALVGSPAGDLFARLVRMNDGIAHLRLKPAISGTLQTMDMGRAAEASRMWARLLAEELRPATDLAGLTEFAFRLSPHVVGTLLGIPRDRLGETATLVAEFVRGLAPSSAPAEIERAKEAAARLTALGRGLLDDARAEDGLMARLARHGRDVEAVVANGIGLLSQAYEATAGLIGNTLLALGREPVALERVGASPGALRGVVRETLRHDPPVQNTRRFVAVAGEVAGRAMAEGDAVLVVLAAANRDPAANPDPHRFDPLRRDARSFTFGAGAHACPGEMLATTIAEAGVDRLLVSGLALPPLASRTSYRPSANGRIPLFA